MDVPHTYLSFQFFTVFVSVHTSGHTVLGISIFVTWSLEESTNLDFESISSRLNFCCKKLALKCTKRKNRREDDY